MSTSTSGVASSSEIDDGGGDLLEAELPGGAEDVVSGEDLAGTAIRDDGPVLAVMAEAVLDRLEVTLHSPLFAACGRRGDLPPPFRGHPNRRVRELRTIATPGRDGAAVRGHLSTSLRVDEGTRV